MGEYVVAFLLRILIIYLMRIFCFYANTQKVCSIAGAPTAIGGHRLSFKNPHYLVDGDFLVYSGLEVSAVKYRLYLGSRKYELEFIFLLLESDGRLKKIL